MKILSLDVSTKTGWAYFDNLKIIDYGQIDVKIKDFNVNDYPDKSPFYPQNIVDASHELVYHLRDLIIKIKPDLIILENTVRGRNRNTQRCLEWFHKDIVDMILQTIYNFKYVDPSEWRRGLEIRLSKEDKKNNKLVRQKKKRGRITAKHLSVRFCNQFFGLNFKIKDNNKADAIALGFYAYKRWGTDESKQ